MGITLLGQIIRSMAMIHASTNFSHMVAFHHRRGHRLVKEGIYRCATGVQHFPQLLTILHSVGLGTLHMPASSIGE